MILQLWTTQDQENQNNKLETVISSIQEKTAKQISTVAIFDLDGTLFDNRPRTVFIMREIAANFEDRLPELSHAMENYKDISLVEYSLDDTLKNIGVNDPKEITFIKKEWDKKFFTDDYQRYDIPIAGASSYVQRVYNAGATVIYLTGRDAGRMLVGMTESLRMFGFPVGIVGTMTLVKKVVEESDEVFKSEIVSYLKRLGSVEAIFENEPLNSNILHKAFPQARSFLALTQHRSDAPKLLPNIELIKDFKIRK